MVESLERRWARLPGLEMVPTAGAAALTFDDGPDPECTTAVLDALDAAGDVRATFFMLGQQLLAHHAIARDVAARGHEIALHGFEHADHSRLEPSDARSELERALWAFDVILGHRPRWFRPPFGRLGEASLEACEELGLDVVYWSAAGKDWLGLDAEQIAANVTARLTSGTIVLLHDSPRFADRAHAGATATAIGRIALAARERALDLRPIGELVD